MIPSRGFRREFWETVWIPWLKGPHQPLCKNLSSGVFFYQFEALKKKKKSWYVNQSYSFFGKLSFSPRKDLSGSGLFRGLTAYINRQKRWRETISAWLHGVWTRVHMWTRAHMKSMGPWVGVYSLKGVTFLPKAKNSNFSKQWLGISPSCDRVMKLSCSNVFSNNLWPGFCGQVSEVRHSHLFSLSILKFFLWE